MPERYASFDDAGDTGARKAEGSLQEKEARHPLRQQGEPISRSLTRILDHLREGIAVIEAELESSGPRILYVNEAWERLHNLPASRAIGRRLRIARGTASKVHSENRILSGGETTGSLQVEAGLLREDGSHIPALATLVPLRDEVCGTSHYIAIQRKTPSSPTEESEQLRRLEALVRIQREVALGTLDLDSLRQRIADLALSLTKADGAAMDEVENGKMVSKAVAGIVRDQIGLPQPMEQSLSGLAYQSSAPLLCRDTQSDARVPFKERARELGFISGILMPLRHSGQVFGVLKVFAKEPDHFDTEELQVLESASEALAAGFSKATDCEAEVKRRGLLLDAIPALISYIDREQRYQEVNAAYEKVFQRKAVEIHGHTVREILGEEGYYRILPYIKAALRGERVNYVNEVPFADGETRSLRGEYVPHFGPYGEVMGFYAIVRDVTSRRNANTDYLTGLANRRQFDQEGARLLSLAKRSGEPISLIMADLDNFKAVNDNHGHQAGDEVLTELAALIRRTSRSSDLACRWGGEEFVLLLPHTDIEGAARLAERLRKELENTSDLAAGKVTASFGLAETREKDSLQSLNQRADLAMYSAKRSGRNRVEVVER